MKRNPEQLVEGTRKQEKWEVDKETKEELGKQMRKREEEKEENETVIVKKKVLILFRLRLLIFFVRRRIRRVVVVPGVIFGMSLVGCLTVIL